MSIATDYFVFLTHGIFDEEKTRMNQLSEEEKQIIHNALNAFQKVLNWCYQIDDDDSRLPLDLLDESHQAINAATIKFQPEKVLRTFETAYKEWKENSCNGGCDTNNDSDVCACVYQWNCPNPECSAVVTAIGEDMEACADFHGGCDACVMRSESVGMPEYENHRC